MELGTLALLGGIGYALYKFSGGSVPRGSAPTEVPSLKGSKPVQVMARAAGGNLYKVWMYPFDKTLGIYTIAQSENGKVWISFFYRSDLNSRVPAKTNVDELKLPPNERALLMAILTKDIETLAVQPKS